jgi:hypothetical protein
LAGRVGGAGDHQDLDEARVAGPGPAQRLGFN